MKFHIVQINEKITDISRKYNVSVEEIVKLNRHINNIDNIVPGMKIRLPILSDEVSDQLKENFLDVEKYYPKLEEFKEVKVEKKGDNMYENQEQISEKTELKEEKPVEIPINPNPQQNVYQAPYYPQYPQYQQYQQPYPQYQQYQQYQQPAYREEVIYPDVKPLASEPAEKEIVIAKVPETNEILFHQPAFCNPELLIGANKKVVKEQPCEPNVYQPYTNLFQNPLFTPPYPCCLPIEEEEVKPKPQAEPFIPNNQNLFFKLETPLEKAEITEFDETVKEIKVDLREFVKKHTQIHKKQDDLDLL